GGTGTSSRVFKIKDSTYTVGAIVQSNFGAKRNLSIAGVPVGIELKDTLNDVFNAPPKSRRQEGDGAITNFNSFNICNGIKRSSFANKRNA
uniref:P1 family peptidase n=1 Tax=Mariniflexile sp. TaxID=1979402 RepID=UPI00404813E7